MPGTIGDQSKLARERQTWILATVFAGMGIGFVIFWVTLVILNASILCAVISAVVWPLSRGKGGSDFAAKATVVFFVATIVGILVGLGSSIGSGLPVG